MNTLCVRLAPSFDFMSFKQHNTPLILLAIRVTEFREGGQKLSTWLLKFATKTFSSTKF